VLTVGTGKANELESSLYEPLRKSVRAGQYKRIALLPSEVTAELARSFALQMEGSGATVTVEPLPKGAEDDANDAYAHFDQVLENLLQHASSSDIVVDFTRGTKGMSAAAVLAAVRHSISQLRYITGQRDQRGMVRAGTERVRSISTSTVDRHRRLDLARNLTRSGDFRASVELLGDDDDPESRAARLVCSFYSAWDRLDYESAAQISPPDNPPERAWSDLWPTNEMRSWVRQLAGDTEAAGEASAPPSERANALRRLGADLIANGFRRVQQGHLEDALVRAYRVLELIGQTRLFEHGLNSAQLDPRDERVAAFQNYLRWKKDHLLAKRGDHLQAGRNQVARLLKRLEDPLAQSLLDYDNSQTATATLLKPRNRNNSILIHGFSARAGADRGPLRSLLLDLARLTKLDPGHHDAEQNLATARSLNFASRG